jgi:hypothetical protein
MKISISHVNAVYWASTDKKDKKLCPVGIREFPSPAPLGFMDLSTN